jgi:DNA (cytosine-5)-methyltransferase 1
MLYGSVCSGIEAASVAWEPLGWSPAWFSEIEPFPSAVLAHRFPHVENRGDMTCFKEWPDGHIDLLVGGTPCQSFSIAGFRSGLADPRGSLVLTYLAIADRYRPKWLVWENVPGILSSNRGRDFGTFLGVLAELGYGWAYRVLDAQYVRVDGVERAVPQRRRRVFVVGHLGDWRRAGAVLFDAASMSRNPPPRRRAREDLAGDFQAGPGSGRFAGLNPTPEDLAKDGRIGNRLGSGVITSTGDVAHCLNAGAMARIDYESETMVVHNEPGKDRNTRFDPVAYRTTGNAGAYATGNAVGALTTTTDPNAQVVAVPRNSTLPWAVRRLTPIECERLQAFPDGWTDIPWRGRANAPDGLRYKALGNSMAVNVIRWIGRRIQLVEMQP